MNKAATGGVDFLPMSADISHISKDNRTVAQVNGGWNYRRVRVCSDV